MDLIIEIVPNEMKQVSRPDYCPLGTKVEKTKKTKKQIFFGGGGGVKKKKSAKGIEYRRHLKCIKK